METNTTHRGDVGGRLRAERERLGITRARLAQLARCSLTSISNIEQGAVPERSRVLDAAFEALYALKDERRPSEAGAVKDRGSSRDHDAG